MAEILATLNPTLPSDTARNMALTAKGGINLIDNLLGELEK